MLCYIIHIEFKLWKEKFEKHTNSQFVQGSGAKELLDCGKTYAIEVGTSRVKVLDSGILKHKVLLKLTHIAQHL